MVSSPSGARFCHPHRFRSLEQRHIAGGENRWFPLPEHRAQVYSERSLCRRRCRCSDVQHLRNKTSHMKRRTLFGARVFPSCFISLQPRFGREEQRRVRRTGSVPARGAPIPDKFISDRGRELHLPQP
jgi:hypothetical protein